MNTIKNEKEVLRDLGRRIREFRKMKGWSQEQFSMECGLHRTYIGSIERGEKNITVLNLIKIKETLGVRIENLLPETGSS